MTHLIFTEVAERAIEWVKANRRAGDFPDEEICEDTDLLGSGVLDSFGLVELLVFLEVQCNTKIDLKDIDAEEFAVVRVLCNLAVSSCNSAQRSQIDRALVAEPPALA